VIPPFGPQRSRHQSGKLVFAQCSALALWIVRLLHQANEARPSALVVSIAAQILARHSSVGKRGLYYDRCMRRQPSNPLAPATRTLVPRYTNCTQIVSLHNVLQMISPGIRIAVSSNGIGVTGLCEGAPVFSEDDCGLQSLRVSRCVGIET
jgi:hypothetical protein